MTMATKWISLLALGMTVVPCFLYFAGAIGHEAVKVAALLGAIAWFVATPLWMSRKLPVDAKEVEI